MSAEDERRVALIPEIKDISTNIDMLLTRISGAVALNEDMATLLARVTAAVATNADMSTLLGRVTAAVATNADMSTLLLRITAARAGYIDNLNLIAPSMVWAGSTAKVVVPGTGADLDFPDVVVAGIPTGVTLKRVDAVLVVGFTLDSSSSENQIKTGTTDTIHVLASGGSWANCISAILVPALSYETPADDYGGGGPIFGNTDIKSVVTGNGTYNFRSEETNKSKAIEATGASLELHVVSIVVRAWW